LITQAPPPRQQQQQPSIRPQPQKRVPLLNRPNTSTNSGPGNNDTIAKGNANPNNNGGGGVPLSESFKRVSPVPLKTSASARPSIQQGFSGEVAMGTMNQAPKTPAAQRAHSDSAGFIQQHNAHNTTANHTERNNILPPSVTPGPSTVLKAPKPSENNAMDLGMSANASMVTASTMDTSFDSYAVTNGNASKHSDITDPMESFESNYVECMRNIRDVEDLQGSNESALLEMRVLFATAYAETLEDQAELVTFMTKLDAVNAFMDGQMEEAQEFLRQLSDD
jgi:hypothetical protein